MPIIKKIVTLLTIIGLSSQAYAALNQSTAQQQSANLQSKAIEFARQAGTIAGVAQACGQNVSNFAQRIAEAINKLTTNPTDKAAAILVYQQITHEAQISEQKMQSIPCTKVLQDYRNLPIMQADYQDKVIAQLNPSEP